MQLSGDFFIRRLKFSERQPGKKKDVTNIALAHVIGKSAELNRLIGIGRCPKLDPVETPKVS
jgi:hypothetical protein